jgi:crotonobetaine/carnitine-CoA ligase
MQSASELRARWIASFASAERTLPAMLTRQAERHGDRTLVTAGEAAWSFAQTHDAAARFAGTLREAGIKPGDRVAVICSNRIEFLEVVLGCGWLGAVAVPINVASRGPQLQHILSNCGARLLVMEAAFAENLALLDPAALSIEAIWLIGERGDAELGKVTAHPMPSGAGPIPAASVQPHDLGLILYTSGTTGPSKGVCCPQAQ